MREEKTLSGVRLQPITSLSLEPEGLGIWNLELEPSQEDLHFLRGSRWLPCARESSSIAPSQLSIANSFLWIMLSLLRCAANAAPGSSIPSPSNKRGKGLKYVEQQAALPLNLIFAAIHCIALQCCASASDFLWPLQLFQSLILPECLCEATCDFLNNVSLQKNRLQQIKKSSAF